MPNKPLQARGMPLVKGDSRRYDEMLVVNEARLGYLSGDVVVWCLGSVGGMQAGRRGGGHARSPLPSVVQNSLYGPATCHPATAMSAAWSLCTPIPSSTGQAPPVRPLFSKYTLPPTCL